MRPDILEEGEFPTCVKCIYFKPEYSEVGDYEPKCHIRPKLIGKSDNDYCGLGTWMKLQFGGPSQFTFDEIFDDLYDIEWEKKQNKDS